MSKTLSFPSCVALAAGMLLTATAVAQTSLTFVKDINTTPSTVTLPSNPSPQRAVTSQNAQKWAMAGAWFYFSAKTDDLGTEFYKSDGTKAVLVKDINKGATSSSPNRFMVVGGKVFFRATTATQGTELWVSDGTTAGTNLVKDIRLGRGSSNPYGLARIGTKLCFSASGGSNGTELWITDGTASGTTMVKDIVAGSSSSSPSHTRSNARGTRAFFAAYQKSIGWELWVTDGTSAGTKLLKDIRAGSGSSFPSRFRRLGATGIVFEANDGKNGIELWFSDGTSSGTKLIKDVYSGSTSGTSLDSGCSLGSKVLFRGRTRLEGYEPWITDGTAAGTMLLKDIRPGSASSYLYHSDSDQGKAWWGAHRGADYEIWVTDGTRAGTKLFSKGVMTTQPPTYITAVGGKVFFKGYEITPGTGYEICMTDGTRTATVKDVRPGLRSGGAEYCSKIGKGIVAFSADDGRSGRELWVSKGTVATTTLIDIHKPGRWPLTASDEVSNIEPLFGKVIFSATNGNDKAKGQHGQELWISDGTKVGTKLLRDIYVGASPTSSTSSYPKHMCRLGNYVYFQAIDGINGAELWRTDGTKSGTKLVKDIRQGSSGSFPVGMTRIRDRIFFRANDGLNGHELWVTDGKPAGTVMVRDIYVGSRSSFPYSFASLGRSGACTFTAFTTQGNELWITDGTAVGTRLVKDIAPGSRSSLPLYPKTWNGKVYFQAFTSAAGSELWVTDGTANGTTLVKDSVKGKSSGGAGNIEVQNGRLYFTAFSMKAGMELHSSDGTSAGTSLYWDLTPGSNSTWPRRLTAVGSRRLFFGGYYKTFGLEPLFLDVTTKEIFAYEANPLGDSSPDNFAGGVYRFAVDGTKVYMTADPHSYRDRRLLRLVNGATADPIGRIQQSSLLTATDPRLGMKMALSGKTSIKSPATLVLLGFEEDKPVSLAGLVPNSYAYFDMTKPLSLIGGVMTGGAWTLSVPVPGKTTLLGAKAVLQAWSIDLRAFPAGIEVSNGVHITIGN